MPHMRYLLYIGIISIISLAITSCSGGSGGGGGGQGISDTNKTTVIINLGKRDVNTAVVSAQQIPSSVCYINFYISAPDMSPIEQTVNVEGGESISTAFAVPDGVNRHFEVFAYDCGDTLLYYGDTYADLDGTSVTITINMVSTADETPPAFGGLISASAISTTEIDLNWAPAADDVTPSLNIIYLIYISTSSGGQNFTAPSFTTPAGAVSHTVTGLSPSTTYYIVVRAKDEAGNIDGNTVERSAVTQTTPDATSPAFGGLISAAAISTTDIALNWTPATDDVTPSSGIVYYIYQAITPGGEDLFNPTYVSAPGAVSYAVNGLVPGTTYYFIVRARDVAGNIDDNIEERWAVTFPSTLQYTLIVIRAGTGTGTVTSNPAGIICGGDCSEAYDDGTVVTLTPTPDAGSYFAGWSGDPDCSDSVVTMNADKTCTATFDNLIGLYVDINTGADAAGCGSPASPCRTITFTLTQTTGNEPIYVAAGTYDSTAGETFPLQLLTGTSLICQGAGYTTVIDEGVNSTAILGAAGASIEGCTIYGDPAVDDNGTAITVDNNMIDLGGGCCTGIALSGNSTVTNSTITGVDDGDVIDVSGGSPTIANNTITYNTYSNGVNISGGNPTLTGNTITYNDDGVQIYGGSATITGNTITDNDYRGVYISNTSPTLTGNTITDNWSSGVYITLGGSPTLSGNTITDNSRGVYVQSGAPVINNNILSCNTGVDLYNAATGTLNAQDNQWDHVPPTEINYPDTCTATGEDICSPNLGGSVDYTGASLAPSPCTTAAGTIDLPETGQTTCYDAGGSVITCAGTGQDGDIQAGVAWPSPRFMDNGDGTVTDNLTGLMWTQDANAPGPTGCTTGTMMSWQGALDYVACLNTNSYLGYTDWRLPNINELESLVNAEESNPVTWLNGQGFTNVRSFWYWSSTTHAPSGAIAAWVVGVWNGRVAGRGKTDNSNVWPVRATTTLPAQLWETGQTICYDASGTVIGCTGTGQDGDIQAGVAWPTPRFTDNGDGTVTDELIGLMWTNALDLTVCTTGTTMTWQGVLDYVACLNTNSYLGYNDWRLPNRKELHSLTDFSQRSPSLPSGHPFILSIYGQPRRHWSSSTFANFAVSAWHVSNWGGAVVGGSKANLNYVWPVRAGQ